MSTYSSRVDSYNRRRKVRIRLCSYQYQLLIAAVTDLTTRLGKYPDTKVSVISLPNKQKYYCVNRSPHVNTNSREQFVVKELSQIIEITILINYDPEYELHYSTSSRTISYDEYLSTEYDEEFIKLFKMLGEYNVPPGIFSEIYSEWTGFTDYYPKVKNTRGFSFSN